MVEVTFTYRLTLPKSFLSCLIFVTYVRSSKRYYLEKKFLETIFSLLCNVNRVRCCLLYRRHILFPVYPCLPVSTIQMSTLPLLKISKKRLTQIKESRYPSFHSPSSILCTLLSHFDTLVSKSCYIVLSDPVIPVLVLKVRSDPVVRIHYPIVKLNFLFIWTRYQKINWFTR